MTDEKIGNSMIFYVYPLFLFILSTVHCLLHADLTSLAKNDVFPVFTTLNIDDALLLTKDQLEYKDEAWGKKKRNHAGFSITPFGQDADRGKTLKGSPCSAPTLPDSFTLCPGSDTALGDLTGRSGMIALLYGKLPAGHDTLPGGPATDAEGNIVGYLSYAFKQFFPNKDQGTITDEGNIDPLQLFGYFSFPLNYRKRGVRFELTSVFLEDFGIRLQAGVSSIRQVVEARINTTTDTFTPADDAMTAGTVNEFLMNQVDNIAAQMGLDIGDHIQTSSEEIRINLFWRHAYELNDDNNKWSHFLLIPYFEASGGFSPGKKNNPSQLFAVPFGNNGHTSVGVTTGVNFDFIETIEVGGEIGFTHFFKRNVNNYRVPNSQFQTTMFPFTTNVAVQPGNNWYFSARIAAFHFLGHLSMHFEWMVVDHKQDKITLRTPDPNGAFLPNVLEKTTTFKAKLGNAGFNYDITPNIGLGFLWQIPFSQRNSYRSSTVMAGINVTF